MKPSKTKRSPEAALADFRRKIDTLDDKLIALLIARMGIIRNVAALKAKHWPSPCHIRSGREGEMHRRIAKAFKATSFPPFAAVTIWRQIIGASTMAESPLRVAYLASEPHHYWLAREYFGPLIQLTSVAAPSLVESSNILILPAPEEPGVNWWRNPIEHKGNPLRLFARIPLVNEELPGDAFPAVALASITPEPSGDDVSYFLVKSANDIPKLKGARMISYGKDHLLILDGFVAETDTRIKKLTANDCSVHFWGAHPRPLSLGVVS